MDKITKRLYFENPNDDLLDELYDAFDEVDFMYGNPYIRFIGCKERLAEVKRYAKALGLKPKD